ncbi:hypothetical protein HRbin36_00944 [bacterium HR36]|nr:hypothetical protein HRbin36_00944 [bacterium HR36]
MTDLNCLRESLRLHLEALRFAGVEWLANQPATHEQSLSSECKVASAAEFESASPSGRTASARTARAGKPRLEIGKERSLSTETQAPASSVPIVTASSLFDQPLESSARTPQEKARALEELNRSQVIGCTKCPQLVRNRTQTVFGVGNPDAALVLVGEAPGQEEDAQGEPFVGPAGQLLNRILVACGLRREEVYICNVLKCRPPNNRTPLPEEIANCRGYLEQQLAIIAPKYICCLGAVAAQTLLQTNQSIGKLRGKVHRYGGAALICTYHPAYLLRNPNAKREVWEDMQLLLRTMGRPIPRKSV